MSAQTLQAIEDAIAAHLVDTTDADESPERAGAVLTAWVVGFEISNIVEVDGDRVLGFANDYTASDSSPNLLAHLARWTSDEISASINGADLDDD